MSKLYKYATTGKTAVLNIGVIAALAGGIIKVYSGTRPATPQTAIGVQLLLTTLTYGDPAYDTAVAGVTTANAIADGIGSVAATDSGTVATFFREYMSDGITLIGEGTVGITGGDFDLELDSALISTGVTVHVTTPPTITQAE